MRNGFAIYRYFRYVLLVFTLCMMAPFAGAGHNNQHQTIGDLEIYITVVPAEMIRGYEKDDFEGQMHGGIPNLNCFHIIVVLFDKNTRHRLTDARVRLQVVNDNFTGELLLLEPMLLAGKLSYGNYFKVPADKWFNIEVKIQTDENQKPISTRFVWART